MPVRRHSEVKEALLDGKATPFYPHCEANYIQQPWTPTTKDGVQYAFIGLVIFVVLQIVTLLVALARG